MTGRIRLLKFERIVPSIKSVSIVAGCWLDLKSADVIRKFK